MSNGNRNNVAECGSGAVTVVCESGKAQEGVVEWIWETETRTAGFSAVYLLRGTCRIWDTECNSRVVSISIGNVTISVGSMAQKCLFVGFF